MNILLFILGCALTDNLIFGRLCGCTFGADGAGVKVSAATGLLTLVVTVVTALIAGLLGAFVPAYLHLLVMAFITLLLTQLLRCLCKGCCEAVEKLWLPVAVGSIMLGVVAQSELGLGYGVLSAFATSVGYGVALIMMAGVRERIRYSKVPAALKGLPISLICAGLMTLAFMGFTGLA